MRKNSSDKHTIVYCCCSVCTLRQADAHDFDSEPKKSQEEFSPSTSLHSYDNDSIILKT